MDKKTTVSVIIPVYNHASTLRDCLGTLVWQAYEQPLEVIIVDDGSTDNFQEVLDGLMVEYPDVRALNLKVLHQENKGAPAARNRGWQEATGEYVIFLDADTQCYPKMIEQMRLALEAHPEVSYAYSQFRFGWKKMKSQRFNIEDLRLNNYIDTTSLIRREALLEIPGPFDESLKRFQDWDLWLTLLEHNKTGIFVPEVLYKKCVQGRKGISTWLPRFMYTLIWKTTAVKDYEAARNIILTKHHLLNSPISSP